MGLFAKKTYICEKCGKPFEKRLNLNGNLCDECYEKARSEREKLEEQLGGYIEYAWDVFGRDYSPEEIEDILELKSALMERFSNPDAVTEEELIAAGRNYKQLTDDAAQDILRRAIKSKVDFTLGGLITEECFIINDYPGIIVPIEDVFAVAYTADYNINNNENEYLRCAIFTNTPHTPTFTMLMVGKLGFFEVLKSKKLHAATEELFTLLCPNLTYPVMELKDLKKTIENENAVKGDIDKDTMMDLISCAISGTGIYNTKKLAESTPSATKSFLASMGYMPSLDIGASLGIYDTFGRGPFWRQQLEKMNVDSNIF